jgi:hypothetical protein
MERGNKKKTTLVCIVEMGLLSPKIGVWRPDEGHNCILLIELTIVGHTFDMVRVT